MRPHQTPSNGRRRPGVRSGALALAIYTALSAIGQSSAQAAPSSEVSADYARREAANIRAQAVTREKIAEVARSQIGKGGGRYPCNPYGPCEDWCAHFTNWVWRNAGVSHVATTASATGVGHWGVVNGYFKPRPAGQAGNPLPGDIVVYGVPGSGKGGHVSIVTSVNGDGTITTVDGNQGGNLVRERRLNPVTARSGTRNVLISGYVNPPNLEQILDLSQSQSRQVLLAANQQHYFGRGTDGQLSHFWWDPTATGNGLHKDHWSGAGAITGQPTTLAYRDQQHTFALDAAGKLRHWWWYPGIENNQPKNDSWYDGSGGYKLVGNVSAVMYGEEQHVFARDNHGNLQHWWWDPRKGGDGMSHDTWNSDGDLAGDPTAVVFGLEQHVYATDSAGKLRHWWWDPKKKENGGLSSDTWGSGAQGKPTVFRYGNQQHVFARGTGGTLEHWWWYPGIENNQPKQDRWGEGIVGDPTAFDYVNQQHVYARTADGKVRHWWWYPELGNERPKSDHWYDGSAGYQVSGQPTALVIGAQQHLFAADDKGNLRHWFWEPEKEANGGMSHDTWGGGLATD